MCWDDCDSDGPEPYENDLEEWGNNEAWQDARAEMAEGDEPLVAMLALDPEQAAEANRLLALTNQAPGPRDGVLMTFTVRFEDGCEADIKVCNGDTGPWIDPVLFDADGGEIEVLSCEEGPIQGQYDFSGYRAVLA